LTKNPHSMETSLNAALGTGDVSTIFAAFHAAIHRRKNIKEFAINAGLDRTNLYTVFRSKTRGPYLDTVIRLLNVLGFQFVVEFVRQPESKKNLFAFRKLDVHPELRSNSKRTSVYLTRAFETAEIVIIVAAFSDVLRAQENIVAFAESITTTAPNLYRSFRAPHVPRFATVVNFLHALGLRLAVRPLPRGPIH
jgi:DNA-binding phage protein